MKKFIIFSMLVSIALVLFLSPFASSFPDGLEKVAESLKFVEKETSLIKSPLPDYSVPFIKNETFSTILSGVVGVLIVYLLIYFISKFLAQREQK